MRRHYRIFEFTVAGTDQWLVALEMDTQANHWRAVARCTSFVEAQRYLETLAGLIDVPHTVCPICERGVPQRDNGRPKVYCSPECKRRAEQQRFEARIHNREVA